ncbi:hypothetical protein [Herbaspirillum seropedicae]|uniref:hypothetical protein n=1 Tax=Herbaspirillum seropedicae TaxID=964 RepID=UPI0028548AEA|nr:hypothetical protein [Herbaspirillum seropedicae]MDR6398515.1 hypothetical protein [Herbaspirillum seropedicae]
MATDTRRCVRVSLLVASAILMSACAAPARDSVPCTILQQSSTCVAVPLHEDIHEDEAKALAPAPEGWGYLYVTRPYSQQRSIKSRIFVDDVLHAELGPKTFARIKLRPGTHTIKLTADGSEAVSIPVEMTKEAFLEYQIVEHLFSVEPTIKPVSRGRARESMRSLDLVVTNTD